MIARAVLGVALVLLVAARPVQAAAPTPATAPSPAELRALLGTLQDDKARAALVAQLRALIAAQEAAAPAAASAPAEPPPQDFMAALSQRLSAATEEVLAGVSVMLDLPRLVAWTRDQLADPVERRFWGRILLALGVVFGMAAVAEWVVRRVVGRLARGTPPSRERRVLYPLLAVLGLIVALLPIAAFAAGAMLGMALTLPPLSSGRAAISLLVQAAITVRLILGGARALLLPAGAWPHLVPASEETRTYLAIWVRRFACWGVFGYSIAGAAWWLGVPGAIYALMLKVVVLGLSAFAVVFILQNRARVGDWIAGETPAEAGGWARLRRRLGDTWHGLAILYICALYIAYALHDERGTGYVVRATAVSLAAMLAGWLLARAVQRMSDRGFAIPADLQARFPQLEARANRYLPIVVGLAKVVCFGLATLVVLQAWDLGSFAWFATGIGRRTAGAMLSIVVVLAVALAAWEITAATIERRLAALDHDGMPSRTRRRTLLPLLRTVTATAIILIAMLAILSQIGIDIAPLLAGAGIIGVAVGFGSQALVKDLITGLFILAEDQIAVGDIVDVGRDHAGVVEAISIRTIRLRDLSGTVHTVPFSEATTIKNLTKEFAFAVARVTVAYGEDIDRVVEILRNVCDDLADDPETGPLVLDRFDYQGVDSLNEFSVVLLLRVRTLPGKQFVVGRALNRRIKAAFDQHAITMRDPSPVQLSSAPPAQLPRAVGGRDR